MKECGVGVRENFVRGGELAVRVLSGTEKSQGLGLRFRSQLLLTPLRDIIS